MQHASNLNELQYLAKELGESKDLTINKANDELSYTSAVEGLAGRHGSFEIEDLEALAEKAKGASALDIQYRTEVYAPKAHKKYELEQNLSDSEIKETFSTIRLEPEAVESIVFDDIEDSKELPKLALRVDEMVGVNESLQNIENSAKTNLAKSVAEKLSDVDYVNVYDLKKATYELEGKLRKYEDVEDFKNRQFDSAEQSLADAAGILLLEKRDLIVKVLTAIVECDPDLSFYTPEDRESYTKAKSAIVNLRNRYRQADRREYEAMLKAGAATEALHSAERIWPKYKEQDRWSFYANNVILAEGSLMSSLAL